MTFRTWMQFAVTELVLSFSPGPAVLFVIGSALRHGAPASLRANLGILSANALYFALSALGLGALLLASDTLYTAIQWIGAVYLVWLGAPLLLPARRRGTPESPDLPGASRLFLRAAALQLANPKTLLFFVALLPQFIDPSRPMGAQIAILGATSMAVEFCVLSLYGFAAGSTGDWLRSPTWQRRLDFVSGAFLIGAALKLASQTI